MGLTLFPPWDSILPEPPSAQSPRFRRWQQQQHVLEILHRDFKPLFEGQSRAVLTRTESNNLVNMLKSGAFGYDFKHRMHFLVLGLEKGVKELGWDVAIPAVPAVARRDRPRFTPDSFADLARLRHLEAAFIQDLENDLPKEREQRIGQILLSAILFGGMLSTRWITPLLSALNGRIKTHGTLLWVEMQRKNDSKPGSNRSAFEANWEISRRWVSDSLTALMIHRLQRCYPGDLVTACKLDGWACMQAYLRVLQPESASVPTSLKQLVSWSTTRAALYIPGFLISYATEKAISVTLPEHVWARLCTGKSIPYSKEAAFSLSGLDNIGKQKMLPEFGKSADLKKQENLLNELSVAVLPSDKKLKRNYTESVSAINAFLDINSGSLTPVIHLLTHWSIDLLSNRRGRGFGRLRPSSVRRYLQSIGKGLLAVLGNENLIGLEASDFQELYEAVVSTRGTTKEKCYTAARLSSFHWFLVHEYSCPPVDITDLGGSGMPKELSVDANLISLGSFDLCLKVLGWKLSQRSRQRDIQCFVALLGFRCGLRRREALTIRIGDLIGDEYPELLVRTNIFAATKTSSSMRRLPLHILLNEDELKRILQWREKRRAEEEEDANGSLLFAHVGHGMEPLEESWVFPDIENAIRQVTGDRSLTFHHLRHSFANWMIMLFFNDFEANRADFDQLACFMHNLLAHDRSQSIRKKLFPNNLDRSVLYWISMLCGHSSPSMTMLHYIHLFDWLLAAHLSTKEAQPKLTEHAMLSLTGLSRAMAYRLVSKREKWYPTRFLKGKVVTRSKFTQLLKNVELIDPDLTPMPQNIIPDIWPLKTIQMVLYGSQVRGMTVDKLSYSFSVPPEKCVSWINNASGLKNRTLTVRHKHMRHCHDDQILFPRAPHEKADIELANRTYLRLATKLVDGHDEARFQIFKFLQKYDFKNSGMRFIKPSDALEYLGMIKLSGVPMSSILIRHMQSKMDLNNEEKKVSSRTWWANQLGIPVDQFIDNERNNLGGREQGSILIQVCADELRSRASYGFRYAMYMLAITGVLKKIAEQKRKAN